MRLQVFLSRSGIASRRAATDIIRSGKLRVNGKKIFEPSFKIDPEKDIVLFNNKRIFPREKIYIILHKPKGVTTTKKDAHAEKTIIDLLPRKFHHLNPVGRLDKDTTGLLLMTNDGEIINKFTHPRFNIEKIYVVGLDKRLKPIDKTRLERGVVLEEGATAPCKIKLKNKNKLEMIMHEGRKRQIKRMFLGLGYKVMDLRRIKEGSLCIGTLPEGKWRFLTEEEIYKLE